MKIKTSEKILDAARKNFIAYGFHGTSINMIADDAAINKSLIYHYYGSKEKLWQRVKQDMLEQTLGGSAETLVFSTESLESFLEDVITFRFNLYDKNPDIPRLIAWQQLENVEDVIGIPAQKGVFFKKEIKILQDEGKIDPDLDPAKVSFLIRTSSTAPFMQPLELNIKERQNYVSFLIRILTNALKP